MEKIIYITELIGYLNIFFDAVALIGWIFFAFDFGISADCDMLNYPEIKKQLRVLFSVAMISTLVVILIPSKKTYLRMHAAEVIVELRENSYWEKALPEETVKIVNEWVKEYE
jgi:hypothetical protein